MGYIGTRLKFFHKIRSMYSYQLELLETAAPPQHGDVLVAAFQSAGRGMGNNKWESEADKNLLTSFFLKPQKLDAEKQFYLNMAVSLSVCHTVKHYIKSSSVTIKWPNDIYVGKRKIAGILISHTVIGSMISYTIAGIGINVNQGRFLSDAPNPVSLIHHLERESDIKECLQVLLDEMNRYYPMVIAGRFVELHQHYISVLYGFAQWRYYIYRDEKIKAKIKQVLPFGQLELVTADNRLLRCNFKEIEFLM